MHIKKLNFAGGRQMQSHPTQPTIAHNPANTNNQYMAIDPMI